MPNPRLIARALATSNIGPRRLFTGPLRALPDYLIIGAQRSGSSSLHAYLTAHPRIRGAIRKEVHFFDLQHDLGTDYYRAHFPLRRQLGKGSDRILAGEATPYYMASPLVLDRVHLVLPDVRLIAVLRNPANRALSQCNANIANGVERLPVREALAAEESRLAHEVDRMLADPRYYSWIHRRFSYKSRGLYAEQLAPWIQCYGRDRLLILQSEQLFADPAATCGRAFDFLGVENRSSSEFPVRRAVPYRSPSDPDIIADLREYYRAPNEQLFALIGERFDWDQ